MEFFYKGIDKNGINVKSVIEANNLDEAKKKLKSQGIFYSELSENQTGFFNVLSQSRQSQLSVSKLSIISRDLSVYLNAGIPLIKALSLMKNKTDSDIKTTKFFENLVISISEGKSFALSLENQEFFKIPKFYTGTLKISEDRGILPTVLNELSSYLLFQDKIKKQMQQAMVYPIFIIVAAILMITFMLIIVVPKITSIFENSGQALPPLTQLIVDIGNIFSSYWFFILITPLLLVSLLIYKINSNYNFRKKFHYFLLKLPIIGKVIETGDLARFSTFSSLLMNSGVPVVNAIKLSCITLSSEVIKETFIKAAEKVVEGSNLSKSLLESEIYKIDPSFIEAIGIGEETSEIPLMLKQLSDMYINNNKDKISIFISVLQPSLMIVIGGLIGLIVIAMLLPIFSLNLN